MKRPHSACPGKDENVLLPPAGLLTITSTSFFTLTLMTILSGSILISSTSSATSDSVVDEVNITVPISCSLTGTGMNTHNAEIPNGTYRADIGTTTLKAFCNDNEGFAIYAAGYTGNEIGGTNSNKLVGTAASSNATIVTGTATSAGNPDISNWAMKLSTVSNPTPTYPIVIAGSTDDSEKEQGDPDFSTYTAVPNSYTKVAYRTSATDIGDNAEGATLTITYAAYISKTQAADTYSGQIIYTLVHPSDRPAPGEFYTGADSIDDITYLQEFAHVSSANRDAIIASMVPERQYTVKDSRDNKTYTIAKLPAGKDWSEYSLAGSYVEGCYNDVCDDTIYNQLSDEWKNYVDNLDFSNNEYWNDDLAQQLATSYTVWMTQNLDLDIDSSKTYTNEDTDLGYNTATGEYDTASWTPIRSTYTPISTQTHEWCNGGTWNSQDNYCENNDTPESYDPGNLYWNGTGSDGDDWGDYYGSCELVDNIPSCDESVNPLNTTTASTSSIPQYHLGNYYNWAAAIATNNSSNYGVYNESTDEVENTIANQSICPAGWTLPKTGYSRDSFYGLWSEYGYDDLSMTFADNSVLWSSPLYSAMSGAFSEILGGIGAESHFWSSLSFESSYADDAFFTLDEVRPLDDITRSSGFSVRCVARPVAEPVYDVSEISKPYAPFVPGGGPPS